MLLQTISWADDVDDLPLAYEFGYAHGLLDVSSVSRCEATTAFSNPLTLTFGEENITSDEGIVCAVFNSRTDKIDSDERIVRPSRPNWLVIPYPCPG